MDTTIVIRPAARGGKYLGMDASDAQHHSALVALMDLSTRRWVTAGLVKAPSPQSAGPANLMAPVSRANPFATDQNTVQIQFNLDIDVPTTYKVLIWGPMSLPGQARKVESEITVLPGVNIGTEADNPEGIVLEIPGLCISNVQYSLENQMFTCSAKVTMMCGCQIRDPATNPNWPWPYGDYEVQMIVRTQSGSINYYPLNYNTNGPESTFSGSWPNLAPQNDPVTAVWLWAWEPKLGNQGTFSILPKQVPAESAPSSEIQQLLALAGKSS